MCNVSVMYVNFHDNQEKEKKERKRGKNQKIKKIIKSLRNIDPNMFPSLFCVRIIDYNIL